MLEWEFDVSIEGKNDQHVIKHKKIGWILIYEIWGKSVNMQKFRGKTVIFQKYDFGSIWIMWVLIRLYFKWKDKEN